MSVATGRALGLGGPSGIEGLVPSLGLAPTLRVAAPVVLVSARCCAGFATVSRRELIVLAIWLSAPSKRLVPAAFFWPRAAQPGAVRPRRAPGGAAVALSAALPPAALALRVQTRAGWPNTRAVRAVTLTGLVARVVLVRRRPVGGSRL